MLKKGERAMGTTTPLAGRRVNFVLSEKAHTDLVGLSKYSMRSMTELVRLGLGLVKLALEEQQNGNKLVVTAADGRQLKEIVLPG
jgi:hypothetical protein